MRKIQCTRNRKGQMYTSRDFVPHAVEGQEYKFKLQKNFSQN